MHIRKVHSAYKCAPGLSERRRLGAAATRGEYHVHRDIFRGSSLPSRPHLYIYIPGASYLYVDIFRPDETLPRIIKLAKYFRATTVITQALLVLLPFSSPSLRTDERTTVGVSPVPGRKTERGSAHEIRVRICLAPCVDADKRIY